MHRWKPSRALPTAQMVRQMHLWLTYVPLCMHVLSYAGEVLEGDRADSAAQLPRQMKQQQSHEMLPWFGEDE